jgi:hypothetical protein
LALVLSHGAISSNATDKIRAAHFLRFSVVRQIFGLA